MAKLELFLLGSTQVRLDRVYIEVKPRKALALLAYLAVTAERHARDALATLLWPESSQRSARKSLRSRLSELNLALGEDWIEADRESIVLRDGYWLDVADFQNALADKDEDAQVLMKAADLYRDDFMAGFTLPDCPEFDDWQFFQAESLRQSFASALQKLIQILSEQEEYEKAIPYGRRWLGLDPMHEPAHQELMRLYAQSGQQASAIRQYDQSRQTLEKELGISPSQETTALYQDIRAGKFERREKKPRPQHNLPVQTSTFIGRERELADIKQLLLEEPGCRLLSLVGPGGIGKTKLALATAVQLLDAFADGVFFVSLAPLSETEDIVLTIAKALNYTFYGDEDPKTQLLDHLAGKEMLLVADNFEHLMSGAYLLSEIMNHAPEVTLLVTSRERLNLQEEWGYDVQGLPFPTEIPADQTEESLLEKYSSLKLFLQRARRANARFSPSAGETADIIRICQYVNGMPLGIELAAPWVRTMSCREIADEIERNLDFLTTSLRNMPERHRSLRVVFEQTWARLSLKERAVLQELSVFRGGCTREAAEQTTGATLPILASLVDKALLQRNNLGRYELHELIRQLAESRLLGNPETAEQAHQNHQDYFVEFLERRRAGVDGARQKETISEIKTDIENVRLAWRRAVGKRDVEAIDRSVECLYVFYIYSSGHYEGQAAFQQAVSALTDMPGSPTRTITPQALHIQKGQENLVGFLLATQAYMLARLSGEQAVPEEVVARLLREKPGNRRREAIALGALSMGIRYQGRTDEAKRYAEIGLSLAVETDEPHGHWWNLTGIAVPLAFSHPLRAKQMLKKALEVSQRSGDATAQGFSNQNLGRTLVELGEYSQAAQHFDKSLHIFTDLDNLQGLGYSYEDIGRLDIALGDYKRAIRNFHQSKECLEETRSTLHINHCQVWLGNAYRLIGDYQLSEETSRAMLAAFNAIEDAYHSGYCLLYLGLLAQDQGDNARAERLLREALATWEDAELDVRIAYAARYLGLLLVAMGEHRYIEAIDYFQQALEGAIGHQMVPLALDIFVGAAHLLADTEAMDRAVELLVLAELHESSTSETKERARGLLAELESQFPPGLTRSARYRSDIDVWDVASDLSAILNILEVTLKSGFQTPRHNLPVHTTTFIGRDREVADIKQLLLEENGCRLLTLVGPGGIGKTRLALAAAVQLLDAFPGGAFFVSLAPVTQTEDTVLAIAKGLNFTFYGDEDPKTQLLEHLARKEVLLVVDNFEHLMGSAHLLSEIINHAPDVTLLVTSRERLNLEEEWGYDVQGLPFPVEITADQAEEVPLEKYSSLELFLQRARQANARFSPSAGETADIIRICQYVDGMPLAIELAAPWVRTMNCREIADEIERNLDFLTTSLRNIPERHRSLRVVFEQTWERLSKKEQAVLQQLSVFRGGCTREAAEQVTGANLPLLASLVDKALVRRNNTGRYELHELIRQFAENQLKTQFDAHHQAQKQHHDFYISFLEGRTAGLKGAGQKQIIGEIKADMDNIRLAWQRAIDYRDAKAVDRSSECLSIHYTYAGGHFEGEVAFQRAVDVFTAVPDAQEGSVEQQALIVLDQQENLVGFLLATQAYFLARISGEQLMSEDFIVQLLRAKPGNKRKESIALAFLSNAVNYQGRIADTLSYAESGLALASEIGEPFGEWFCLLRIGSHAIDSHPIRAEQYLNRALSVCQRSGDPSALGWTCKNLGVASIELGKYDNAAHLIRQAIDVFGNLESDQGLGDAYEGAGILAIAVGDYNGALQNFRQALTYFSETRSALHANQIQVWMGYAFRLLGDHEQAEQLSREALSIFTALDDASNVSYCLINLGCLARVRGELVQAERFHREALDILQPLGLGVRTAESLLQLGTLLIDIDTRHNDEARQKLQRAVQLALEYQVAPLALDVCVGVAYLLTQMNELERAVELLVLAEQHEASTFETKEEARGLLTEIKKQLPIENFDGVRERQSDLWNTVESLSAMFGSPSSNWRKSETR